MNKAVNQLKLCRLMIGLSLSLLLIAGCTPSQPIPRSTSQAAHNTTQPTNEQSTSVQATTTPWGPRVPTIATLDANDLIQKNKDNPNFMIIDVRIAEEFDSGHIANSINIDYYSPDFKSVVSRLDENNQYLVYCETGGRGASISE